MIGWSVVLFLTAFAGFLCPGYLLATALSHAENLGRPTRCALGFAFSFAAFAVVGAPFLWFGYSFAGFLSLLYPVWGVFTVLAGVVWYLTRRVGDTAAPVRPESSPPVSMTPAARSRSRTVLVAYLAATLLAGWAWASGTGHERQTWVFAAPLLLVAGCGIAWRFRRAFGSLIRFDSTDDEPAPRLWTAIAAGVILLQAVSAVVGDRAEWDDCFYLAAAADYQQAEVLNEQEPTYREGFPMPTAYRLLCWELWGASLCHLCGVGPAILFHSFLPGLLVLLVYAAYAGLLGQLVPRRWLPLALLGLSAVHLWGISSHWTAANYLLPRVWQSKAVLLHLALPLLTLLLLRFALRPSWRVALSLAVCAVFALALSRSATFLVVVLVGCLTLSLWRATEARRARLLAGAALLLVLAAGVGLFLWDKVRPTQEGLWQPQRASSWLIVVDDYTRFGCVEVIWLLSLPLLAALAVGRRAVACLVIFPVILAATVVNPLLFDFVAGHFTTYDLYLRLLWLFPVALGLAVLFALTVRFLAVTWGRRRSVAFPLGLALSGLALTFLLPSIFVWGPRNAFLGPLAGPRLAANLEKMPADLVPLARRLADDPEIKNVRILCNPDVASFLTPFSRDFRFVQTQTRYLSLTVESNGEPSDGLVRHILASVLTRAELPPTYGDYDLSEMRDLFGQPFTSGRFRLLADNRTHLDARELLTTYRVKYVILAPNDRGADLFERNGYRVAERHGDLSLWADESWSSREKSTIPQRPHGDNWIEPMRQVHARFRGTPGTLLTLGDSITMSRAFWTPLAEKPHGMPPAMTWDCALVRKHLRPECWGGWKGPEYGNQSAIGIGWAMDNIDAWLARWNPEVAVILFGTNDLPDWSVSDFEEKTRQLVDRCLANGTVVILTTVPPRSGYEDESTRFAEAVREIARDTRVPLIDYHAEILARRPLDWDGSQPPFARPGKDDYEVPTLISGDGRHPSNPRKYQDYSPESLRRNGYGLRNYLTLTAYADVIRNVLRSGEDSR
jgi:hypothetical protein